MHQFSNLEVIIFLGILIVIISMAVVYQLTRAMIKSDSYNHIRTRQWIKLLFEKKLDVKEFYEKGKDNDKKK